MAAIPASPGIARTKWKNRSDSASAAASPGKMQELAARSEYLRLVDGDSVEAPDRRCQARSRVCQAGGGQSAGERRTLEHPRGRSLPGRELVGSCQCPEPIAGLTPRRRQLRLLLPGHGLLATGPKGPSTRL